MGTHDNLAACAGEGVKTRSVGHRVRRASVIFVRTDSTYRPDQRRGSSVLNYVMYSRPLLLHKRAAAADVRWKSSVQFTKTNTRGSPQLCVSAGSLASKRVRRRQEERLVDAEHAR